MGDLLTLKNLQMGFAGLGALTSAVSGFGEYEAGQEKKAAYDYNAAVSLQRMQEEMQTSETQYAVLTGRQASRYAAAGVDIASGSPLLVMAHTAAQGAKEQESEYLAGTEEAALQRYYGKVAAFSGTVGGISTFLSGLAKSGSQMATIMA
jgi:hypothetical protein